MIPAKIAALAVATTLFLSGCYYREAGPAERVGRSLDEIMGALGDYDDKREVRPYPEQNGYPEDGYYDSERDPDLGEPNGSDDRYHDRRPYRNRYDYESERRY